MLAPGRQISMLRATIPDQGAHWPAVWPPGPSLVEGFAPVKVIASSLRKGNIVDLEGRLYVILTAENIHPGKGTPVTQVDMRRLSDGVKSSQRYKTTDSVERALVEEREFQFLYQDGDGFHFMNMENYDQIAVPEDVIGDQAKYLHAEMKVKLSVHEGVAVGIVLPQRVTLEVSETEPTTRGQTASSSYKPAVLSNGVRTTVPPHIVAGTRIVVSTEDGSYVERAKD
jgi:elongation factor P